MGREHKVVLPLLQRILTELGENIRLAHLRRKFSAAMVAERAGIARNTLRAIEAGDPRVTLGAYANVLLSLGLENDLKLIMYDDELGRKLQDAALSVKERAPRRSVTHVRLKEGISSLKKKSVSKKSMKLLDSPNTPKKKK